tara:strand:+ start:7554 stop:8237 length:684 start_codon:yes stop_codon:yes gene_type:complete
MINHKLISVIMGAYNCEATIRASIESILKQTYTNLELLVVDDGSDDRTYDICKSIRDKRLKIYKNNKNIGLTKSLNKLISYSNGEFIARQDADDISQKNRLDTQMKYLIENDLDVCTSRAEILNSSKKIPGISYYLPLKIVMMYKNPFIHGTLLIKKHILEEVNFYDESFYYAQDYKLMNDLIKKQKKIKILKDNLYILNMSNNISILKKDQQKYFAKCVRKNISPL